MLCKHQTVLDEPCMDGTSRSIRCSVGFANNCMKQCHERCERYEPVVVPQPVPRSTVRQHVSRFFKISDFLSGKVIFQT